MRRNTYLSALFLLIAGHAAFGQSKGSLVVTITDSNYEPIPGVILTLTGPGRPLSMVSDSTGKATFMNLAPDQYNLQCVMAGFKTIEVQKLKIKSGKNRPLAVTMEFSNIQEMIIVTASPNDTSRFSPGVTGIGSSRARPNRHDPSQKEVIDREPANQNRFIRAADRPTSTFSIDVDTAAYANVRGALNGGHVPKPDMIRIEEMINYFDYDDPEPEGDAAVAVRLESGPAPWHPENRLVRIGLRARGIDTDNRPACNLVFLLDVSGSMQDQLPLVKQALSLLAENLGPRDRVSIVVYAGRSGLVLPPTAGDNASAVFEALASLESGGSTNADEGIQLAYRIAAQEFIENGANRVILATDGDFNVGLTSGADLADYIQTQTKQGIFLTVLGFGDNAEDFTMEQLADKGNGFYAFIDDVDEAWKVLVEQIGGTLVTTAKDVKLQVIFNRREVTSYRLIGYENRLLPDEAFDDDTVDAGDMGAGHSVTALYEVVPTAAAGNEPMLQVKIRYKKPRAWRSKKLVFELIERELEAPSPDFQFAAAVAAFGMVLQGSEYAGDFSLADVQNLAERAIGFDPQGHRTGFLDLVATAAEVTKPAPVN